MTTIDKKIENLPKAEEATGSEEETLDELVRDLTAVGSPLFLSKSEVRRRIMQQIEKKKSECCVKCKGPKHVRCMNEFCECHQLIYERVKTIGEQTDENAKWYERGYERGKEVERADRIEKTANELRKMDFEAGCQSVITEAIAAGEKLRKSSTLCGKCNLGGKLCKECYANRRANSLLGEFLAYLQSLQANKEI